MISRGQKSADMSGSRGGKSSRRREVMVEPGFWLIIAGGLLVGSGLIGLVFSRAGREVHPVLDQIAGDPVKLPAWFSTDQKAFGRAVPKQTGGDCSEPTSVQACSGRKSLRRIAGLVENRAGPAGYT